MKFKGRVDKEGQNRRPRQTVTSLEIQDINMKRMENCQLELTAGRTLPTLVTLTGWRSGWDQQLDGSKQEKKVKEFM